MSPSSVAILTDPQPWDHIVYPYTNERQLTGAVTLFAAAGLRKGEAILLVMTKAHAGAVRESLEAAGFDLAALETAGQLTFVDALAMLSTCLQEGVLEGTIQNAKVRARNRPLRIFGEIVDLIWKADLQATQRLEELWNEVIKAHSVPLLCAYSLAGTKPSAFPDALLACHSQAVI